MFKHLNILDEMVFANYDTAWRHTSIERMRSKLHTFSKKCA